MPEPGEYLKVKEAAELLGVCPNTIRAWGGQGKIPEFRHPINRFRLYRRSDLEAVLKQIARSHPYEASAGGKSISLDQRMGPATRVGEVRKDRGEQVEGNTGFPPGVC